MYERGNIAELVPKLDANGVDLLCKLLEYVPEKRISAEKALLHPYFDGMRPE
ncbi:Cell division protein kinase 1 [Chytriomyces hyalinus]|nr:Cell division protein kinase 1 [Chytriomyces hyalinus]